MNQEKINEIVSANHPYARATEFSPIVRIYNKISRNSLCPHSNKKFKHCCGSTGQNFCDKAKDMLRSHLEKIHEKNNTEETQK